MMNSTQGSLFDCSTSSFFQNSTLNGSNTERSFNGFRQVENPDAYCTPHFFGATLRSPTQMKRDALRMNMDDSTASRSFLGHTNSSINRSNTFSMRSTKENRFNPYPMVENEKKLPNGPPLRSLRNHQPPLKRIVQRELQEDDVPMNTLPSPEERDFWVTVFGFDMEDIDSIIELFGRHGQILKAARPSKGEGNWVHLRYASKTHVDQALQRNGHIMGKKFIGVAQSPQVNYGYDSEEWEVSTPVLHAATKHTPEEAVTRRATMRRLNGMRPLAVVPQDNTQSKASGFLGFFFKGGKK